MATRTGVRHAKPRVWNRQPSYQTTSRAASGWGQRMKIRYYVSIVTALCVASLVATMALVGTIPGTSAMAGWRTIGCSGGCTSYVNGPHIVFANNIYGSAWVTQYNHGMVYNLNNWDGTSPSYVYAGGVRYVVYARAQRYAWISENKNYKYSTVEYKVLTGYGYLWATYYNGGFVGFATGM